MAVLLLVKSKFAHQAGYYLHQGRWHKVQEAKPAPKSAPISAHPHAAGHFAPISHLADHEWEKLKLPPENVNAGSYNKQLMQLKQMSDSGNITGILGSSFGTNTYGKKLAIVANHLLELHGSTHKVTPGQKPGTHAAVQAANDSAPPAPAPEPVAPKEEKKDEALRAAVDHLKEDSKQEDIPEPEKEEDKALIGKLEAAQDSKPGALEMPDFVEGKDTPGVKKYYDGVASKIIDLANAGDSAGLAALKEKGLQPNSKGKIGHTWKGKTQNSKLLLKLHEEALASVSGAAPKAPEQEAAPQSANKPVTQKVLGKLIARKIAEQKKSETKTDYLDKIKNAGSASTAEMYAKLYLDEHKHSSEAVAAVVGALKGNGFDKVADGVSPPGDTPAPAEQGPKDGDTKQGADGMLVFKNGRWHKQEAEPGASLTAPEKSLIQSWVANGNYAHSVYEEKIKELQNNPDAVAYAKMLGGDLNPAAAPEPAPEPVAAAHPIDAIPEPDLSAFYSGAQIKVKQSLELLKDKVKAGDLSVLKGVVKQMSSTGKTIFTLPSLNQYVSKMKVTTYGDKGDSIKAYLEAVKAAAGKPPKKQKAKAAPTPSQSSAPGSIESMDSWAQTGPQAGSNPGGRFKDENGVEWYCKFPADENVAKSELLASKLYAAAGIAGQDAKLITKGGKVGIASRWVSVKKANSPSHLAAAEGAQAGFAVDAWLGNWDVVGAEYDNLQIGADGKAIRVDAGGSLHYRAQGGKKAFGDNVIELDSLRDHKINPQAASVFANLTDADITASAAKLAKLQDASIKILVNTYGPGDQAAKEALANTLIARKNDILAKYPAAAKKAKAVTFDPSKINAPPSFTNWGDSGKSGPSSKDFLNQANEVAVQAIYAASKSGKVEDIEKLEADVFDKNSGLLTGKVKVLSHPSQHVKGYAEQVVNEINYQQNPPKVFRFDGGHPLHSIDQAYPAYTGPLHSSAVSKLGKFVLLGEPGSVKPEDLALPKLTYKSGAVSQATYSPVAQAAIAKMPFTQQQAVKSYTGSKYQEMNHSLWSGNPNGAAKSAKEALHTLGHEIKAGTVLSRKITLNSADTALLTGAIGKVLQEPAIMSTSIRPSTWSGNVQLKLHVGPGVKGLWVGYGSMPGGGAMSLNASEDEVLLPPNTRILIISSKMTGGSNDADGFGGDVSHVVEAIVLPTSGE